MIFDLGFVVMALQLDMSQRMSRDVWAVYADSIPFGSDTCIMVDLVKEQQRGFWGLGRKLVCICLYLCTLTCRPQALWGPQGSFGRLILASYFNAEDPVGTEGL